MMATFYVARHGQNVDNANGILNGHRDLPLTELGEKQAETLGQQILASGLLFSAVYTSPLQRASRTAELVCSALTNQAIELHPVVERDLIERDFGVMSGKRADQIEALCGPEGIIKTPTVTYFLEPEGAESFPALIRRAEGLLQRLASRHADSSEKVLLVCHGDFGKAIYAAYYKEAWQSVLTDFHFGNSEVLVLSEHLQKTHGCDEGKLAIERKKFSQEQFNQ